MNMVYGIDLGTSYSAVAALNDAGKPEIVKNLDGESTTPSVVHFETENNIVVGTTAKNAAAVDADMVVSTIKRQMGDLDYTLDFHGQEHTPESVSAAILRRLVQDANIATGLHVSQVAITVPAYFGVQEREATRNAGRIAGLDVVGLLPEPLAAALAYGHTNRNTASTVFVFDLGGGTFDTTVLRISPDTLDTLVVDGDATLGGSDWDEELLSLVVHKFAKETGIDPDELHDDFDFTAELTGKVEAMKRQLAAREQATLPMNFNGERARVEIGRAEFDDATSHLLARCRDKVNATFDAMRAKGLSPHFDDVLLVGGSTRMPAVQAMVAETFGVEPKIFEPDEAVAKGAAVFASLQSQFSEADPDAAQSQIQEEPLLLGGSPAIGKDQPLLSGTVSLTTVLPRGIAQEYYNEEKGDYLGWLAHRNDPLPLHVTSTVHSVKDGQHGISLRLREQAGDVETEVVEEHKRISPDEGTFLDWGGPKPKDTVIEQTMTVTAEGLIRLHAYEPESGQEITVETSIETMSDEAITTAKTGLMQMTVE